MQLANLLIAAHRFVSAMQTLAFALVERDRRRSRIHARHANRDQLFDHGANLDHSVIPAAGC